MHTCSGCDGGRRYFRNGGACMSYGMTSHFRRPRVTTFITYTPTHTHFLKNKWTEKPKNVDR